MSENDTLQRFIFENAPVRGEFIKLTDTYQTIALQHDYPTAVRQLLGEALCVTGLLSAILKHKGRLTLQFRGTGLLKLLLVQCDHHLNLRGLVKWEGEVSGEALLQAFKLGTLGIMIDSDTSTQRYQGVVAWEGGSLAESIEHYFKHSEQLQTKVLLTVDEKQAAGCLLQVIPKETQIEHTVSSEWNRIAEPFKMIHPNALLSTDYLTLLKETYPEEEIRVFPSVSCAFKCSCSRERSAQAIFVMGQAEAEEELKLKQLIVVTCEFCNQEYEFDKKAVAHIFIGGNTAPSQPLH